MMLKYHLLRIMNQLLRIIYEPEQFGSPDGRDIENQPSSSPDDKDNRNVFRNLYNAALKDEWRVAEAIIKKNPSIVVEKITKQGATVLHVSTRARSIRFVGELMKVMEVSDLELKDDDGNTAFNHAAMLGFIEIAKAMVERNKNLPNIPCDGVFPIKTAAAAGHEAMVSYLFDVTSLDVIDQDQRFNLFTLAIYNEMYDAALNIFHKDRNLACKIFKSGDIRSIYVLSQKSLTISNQEVKLKRQFTSLFITFLHRQEKVFSLIHQIRGLNGLLHQHCDNDGNNILHLAGRLGYYNNHNDISELEAAFEHSKINDKEKIMPVSFLRVSGAALQMQREMLWFKEVEKLLPPSHQIVKNKSGKTPRELFTEEHKLLLKEGERWMKDTANSCMIAATLIATMVFAAGFTVPGGNNDDNGIPILLYSNGFRVFVISDAVALFSSIVSIIMFLSILTSRYGEDDFIVSLPTKLLFGLSAVCLDS